MGFKKSSIKKTSPIIINTIGIISIFIVFLFGIFLIKNITFFDFKKIEKIVLDNNQNNFKKNKQENINYLQNKDNKILKNKLNILVAGRGGGNHDAPNLTDTIILISINIKTKIISMLSIPRDFYVEYGNGYKNGKINGIYAKYKFKNNSSKVGMEVLKNIVSEITGEKIDYFVNIDFDGFINIIDTIGGIKINIPKQIIDNKYPDGNWGHKTLIFKKGTWLFDGESALKYSRSRHSTSDFDRGIRQQQVIASIKNKLLSSYILTSPLKIKKLYNILNKYIYSNIDLKNLLKLIVKLNNNYKVISSNLNDSCFYGSDTCTKGGFLYTPDRNLIGGASVLLAEGTDTININNYKKLHKYTNIIFNYPAIFNENLKINIFNSLKINHLAGILSNDIIKYGFNIPAVGSIGNTNKIYEKSIIYYNNIGLNSITIKVLKKFTNIEFIKTDFPIYSKDNANIEIIIGKDYLIKDNIFKF